MTHMFSHRTYEPFKFTRTFLGRLTLYPLRIDQKTWPFTRTQTWEDEPPYRVAPTLVVHLWPLTVGFAVGWWMDSGIEDLEVERWRHREIEEANAAYDAYVAVNGEVDREQWAAARRSIASRNLDYEEEMEVMQMLGVFE